MQNTDTDRAFIRGVYLGGGWINNPNNTYHMEILVKDDNKQREVYEILKQNNINSKLLNRENAYSIYLNEGEEISKILAFMGANKAVLNFEEIRVMKEISNNVNRKVNCETANLNKTINAAINQIEAINKIIKSNKFEELPQNLQEIAILRKEHPEASLIELGSMLTKPIGKSGVNHRLKSIIKIAEEI